MTCMPESGGCERQRTEPFVDYINEAEGSKFEHQACLDRLHRDSPQPEALYADATSGAELVIERKSVMWPLDYAARHRNDHHLAELLFDRLGEVAADRPISIDLEPASRMTRLELRAFADEIADAIDSVMNEILDGRTIGSLEPGRSWRCSLDPEERAFSDAPPRGLILRWSQPNDAISPDSLPTELACHIRGLFSATVEKFRGYPLARGILLLDPYGSLRHAGDWWWRRAFETVSVPNEIAQVWLATYDWLTETEQGWIFDRLHTSLSG